MHFKLKLNFLLERFAAFSERRSRLNYCPSPRPVRAAACSVAEMKRPPPSETPALNHSSTLFQRHFLPFKIGSSLLQFD